MHFRNRSDSFRVDIAIDTTVQPNAAFITETLLGDDLRARQFQPGDDTTIEGL